MVQGQQEMNLIFSFWEIDTNVYKNGTGNREMRHMIWFDPTEDCHTSSILCNNHPIVFGAGKGKSAKFAMQVSVAQSTVIGFIFCILIMIFDKQFAYIFTTSPSVLEAVNDMSILLAVTILLNSVQPILSGVAVGSGWQVSMAYINIGCYYLIGLPLGILMGWVFHTGVEGIWAGMIFGGTTIQTFILIIVTARCDWKKEAEKATTRVNKWSIPNPDDQLQITN